ncbi:hypothetical protein Tco_0729597 [Tanacetum coccineum]|uniref:Uncharacterized protein n=1 Tax=Tanacetum coccineum TaxID=301880 RepID=A0ABQ4YQH6_9ASTR
MAYESTSSQQSTQLTPSLKVSFKYEDGIIAFNNVVALLEHQKDLYCPMLAFLSNCYINKALIFQPSAIYAEYLKEFWYTAEVDEANKTITFSLSMFEKPLSFTQDEFLTAIGLPICKIVVPLPIKETVRARSLGIVHDDQVMEETESPYDTELEIKFIKSFQAETISSSLSIPQDQLMKEVADSDLESILEDEVESVSGFEEEVFDDDDDEDNQADFNISLTKSEEKDANKVIDELTDLAKHPSADISASVVKPSESDPLGHFQKEINSLYSRFSNLE